MQILHVQIQKRKLLKVRHVCGICNFVSRPTKAGFSTDPTSDLDFPDDHEADQKCDAANEAEEEAIAEQRDEASSVVTSAVVTTNRSH